ncbi:ABC transporter substrate-binding protein [Sulfobacillus harzensis]|uniref:ABC transporter substrate-binding protein n=1 Tax=Sulfobacillus harzensis TaxID=2729629 RepID=A0A7Y0L800_9FIRM|nr:ABC transporter substrate-binding protein [Sulfobacillus harzensis]NMP24120.1 ABC transporter substrate-binding protein [Sulfobacillus harzensis]
MKFGKHMTAVGLVSLVAIAASACGSGSAAASGSPVVIDVFSPFSGPNAFIGNQYNLPPVSLAAKLINQDGGVLGHKVQVITTDSGQDVGDAVSAANKLFAQYPNLNGEVGITSDVASAVVPLFNTHKIPMMSLAGNEALDKSHYTYFYRVASPDSLQGAAMAQAALKLGYKTAAILMDNSGSTQSNVPALVKAYERHGGKVVVNLALASDQSSYRTEVEKVAAAHPQVIFTETDPQTAATLFANMKQLGILGIPTIGGQEVDVPAYFQAVANAVGGYSVEDKFLRVSVFTASKTPGFPYFQQEWNKIEPKKDGPAGPIQGATYDAANILALAMDAAHSTNPTVYVKYIRKVTDNPSGQVVTNYAQGAKLLKEGKQISYQGAVGPLKFNQYNWPTEGFDLFKLNASGKLVPMFHQPGASVANFYLH